LNQIILSPKISTTRLNAAQKVAAIEKGDEATISALFVQTQTQSIRHRHTDVALFLIARGADVKFADRSSFLPLCNAVYNHSEQIAIALINAGAPLDPPHMLIAA
jgi:hypothetical protein